MLRLRLFTADAGPLVAWLRVRRRNASPFPDLFDRIDAVLETRNEGRTWFVSEYAITRRFTGIGNGYQTLLYASRFTALILKNPLHNDAWLPLFERLEQGFESWASGAPPDIVYLKMLYLFAREEGFPVREDWWKGLPTSHRDAADLRLHRPLDYQSPKKTSPATGTLIENLENWLRERHEIRF